MSARRQYLIVLTALAVVVAIACAVYVLRDNFDQDTTDALARREAFAKRLTELLRVSSDKWGTPEVWDQQDPRGPDVIVACEPRLSFEAYRCGFDGTEVVAVATRKDDVNPAAWSYINKDGKCVYPYDSGLDKALADLAVALAKAYWAALDESGFSKEQ
jgi:hypothetical protein